MFTYLFIRWICQQSFSTTHKQSWIRLGPSPLHLSGQNKKAKQLNCILKSSIWAFLAALLSTITLWGELIKTVAYLQSCSQNINGILIDKPARNAKPKRRKLKMISSRSWMQIRKGKRSKQDLCSLQSTFIECKCKNQYQVSNLYLQKINITWDLFINK